MNGNARDLSTIRRERHSARILAASILLLVGSTVPAHAYFEVKQADAGSPATTQQTPDVDLGDYEVIADRRVEFMNYVGTPNPEIAALPAGFSNGIRLDTASKLLLPPGWRALIKNGVDRQTNVSWSAGGTWLNAYEQIAHQIDASVTVVWDKKVVLIAPLPPEASTRTQQASSTPPPGKISVKDALAAKDAEEAPGKAQPESAPAAGPQASATESSTPHSQYTGPEPKNLQEFLNQEVRIDLTGATITEVLYALIPAGWNVDVKVHEASFDTTRIDITTPTGARGAVLDAIGKSQGLTLIPYLDFKKLVVAQAKN